MAELILFHHARGLTEGVRALAERLGAPGHRVRVPDLYDGLTFPSLEERVAHAEGMGLEEIIARGEATAEEMPPDLVYVGLSLGVLPAQRLAQSRPGAPAALLYHGCVPPSSFGAGWPRGVPLQIHVIEDDEWGDVDVARELARTVEEARL